jgi:HD-GYP domain-containing protein (c-di-GMP phosphodiesterase class II)
MPSKNQLHEILAGTQQLSALADPDEILQGLSRFLKKTVKSRWAVVYLLDQNRRDFAPARSAGLPSRYMRLFSEMPLLPEQFPLLKTIIRRKQHLLIMDAGQDERMIPSLRHFLRNLNLLAVPMVVRNQVTGVVFVARGNSLPPFTQQEVAIVGEVVSHAALLVSHIRLFDESLDMAIEMAKRIDIIATLDEINKAISSSLNRNQVIETALEQIERVISYDLVAVLAKDKLGLCVMASHGTLENIPSRFQPGEMISDRCLALQAFTASKSRYIPDLSQLKRLSKTDRALAVTGIATLLAIPLTSRAASSGVLLLGSSQPGRFAREDTFVCEKIAAQMAVALENARLFEEMRSLFFSTVSSLANAIDAKSPWTKGHSERVMHLSARLAKSMGLPEDLVERVRLGGLLHDIGKIGIIEALLEKPTMLSEDEFPPMRLHPEKGVAILAPIEQLQDILPAILHHHEWYDGSGYPTGLKGENIPIESRIIAVADAFDAMAADRPYRRGFSSDEAIAELKRCAGQQFDPHIVEAFIRYMGR